MISGELSVSAMKPSIALRVSGVSAGAAQTPLGNALRTAASRAAEALALRTSRRLSPVVEDFILSRSLRPHGQKRRPLGTPLSLGSAVGARVRRFARPVPALARRARSRRRALTRV